LRELIGLCIWCGCSIYSDGPVDFENVWCSHEIQIGLEEMEHEDSI
jgi:hypothetical protein